MSIRLDCIGLVVSDMAATLAFYRRLGLDVPPGADQQPHVEVALGGLRMLLDTEDTMRRVDPGWTPPTGGHRAALAFRCDDPAEVDATWAAMTAVGYHGHLAPWDAYWGQRYAILHDPDGRPAELYADLPVTLTHHE